MGRASASAMFMATLVFASPAAAQEQGPATGSTLRDCANCPEMVVVPPGRFTMGAAPDDPDAFEGERPQREISIKAFALGKFEVTFDEWDSCHADGGCAEDLDDLGLGRGRRPVTGASWNHAMAYVAWLSKKSGKAYRLPSEAEWEYAARAGTATRFSWGNDFRRSLAHCSDCLAQPPNRPAPVGTYPPNAFGLHDMHGNVWEWASDCWNPTHEGAPPDGAPRMTGQCTLRVVRGGSWGLDSVRLRSSVRARLPPNWRGGTGEFGFRVARSAD